MTAPVTSAPDSAIDEARYCGLSLDAACKPFTSEAVVQLISRLGEPSCTVDRT